MNKKLESNSCHIFVGRGKLLGLGLCVAIAVFMSLTSLESTQAMSSGENSFAMIQDDADKKDAGPDLNWKKEEGASLFASAKESFDKKDYRQALLDFKKVVKFAKDKKTKSYVKTWRLAADGGFQLSGYKQQLDTKKRSPRKIYYSVEKIAARYDNTPIESEYRSFLKSLRDDIFVSFETFDRKSSRFSEKRGKTFIKDAKMVKQGKASLKWEVSKKNHAIKIKTTPKDVSSYYAISFWVHMPKRGGASYEAVFKCKGAAKGAADAFMYPLKPHRGWRRIEIPLERFQKQGKADFTNIDFFQIQFKGGRKFTCHLDEFSLIKK